MADDQLKQLAETLMKTGMASSTYDAMEKAKSILNVKSQRTAPSQGTGQIMQQNATAKTQQSTQNLNIGVNMKDENVTLNELMREIGIDPEQVAEQEHKQKQEKIDNAEEKIEEIKEEIKEAENAPEKFEQIREEIEEVKGEIADIEEMKEEINGIEAENEEQLNIDEELKSLELEQQTQQPEQQNQEDEQQGMEQEDAFEEEEKK